MSQQKLNIFLVDDDHIYQFTAKKTLETMGLAEQVSVFMNGASAIQYIKDNLANHDALPDVIFLDINMPVMDGWQFVQEFEQLEVAKPISVYMVSSSVDESDMKRSREFSVITDYIIKPVGRTRFQQLLSGK
jgi:CheY-like chemotaxis protein